MASGRDIAGPLRRSTVLQRLLEVLEEQDHVPLRIAELCKAIGTPQRTLHSFCKATFGMGLLRYLLLKRLGLAREALLRGQLSKVTVTAVATQYGFTELGRFAAAYKAQFGELPSETLRRRVERPTVPPSFRSHGGLAPDLSQ